ncbi:MAG: hypothetical protein JXA87_06775, partial [Thermoleophilia bacterium]|nr:hypothetical protein [Thermoleophilia bacterium]
AGMVQAWLDARRPECEAPARHSTGQRWAATMDAILRLAGFDGFLTNFEASEHAFDARYQVVEAIAQEHHLRPPATAAAWVAWLGEILEDRFKDRRGNPKSARACATIVGSLLRDYVDARFPVGERTFLLERAFPEGPTHQPTYGFREVAP